MLEILEAGGIATLQDAGRFGWRRFGVPASGPMDAIALRAANLLVDNDATATALEIGAGDLTLQAKADCVIAVTGAGYKLSINVWNFPLWGSFFVRSGWPVRLEKSGFGIWAYLAIAGGFDASPALGSRSTYLRGHFGGIDGRLLGASDLLQSSGHGRVPMEAAARTIKEDARPDYHERPVVDVMLGPQSDRYTDEVLQSFLTSSYRVGSASDRMGYRLEGPALKAKIGGELTSEGISIGSIQVPADGQPIVMMADSATAGGYPKIACVASVDLPLLAQCTPGRDEVRFRQTGVEAAQAKYRTVMDQLKHGIVKS